MKVGDKFKCQLDSIYAMDSWGNCTLGDGEEGGERKKICTSKSSMLPSGQEKDLAPGGGLYVPQDLIHTLWKKKV